MKLPRASGVLLHPTCLPGEFGVGDLGPEAKRFLQFLAASGQQLWQVLPLNPPGPSNSPYAAYSAFAGNPLLISPQQLVMDGLLEADEVKGAPTSAADRVDFASAIRFKTALLRRAHAAFTSEAADADYVAFCEGNAEWLADYALFMALKDAHKGDAWNLWEPGLVRREPKALEKARKELAEAVDFYSFCQYLFAQQHEELKREANHLGIQIIGDLPIFVAHNSADVWANQTSFYLDASGNATQVAGVPPDYFSKTGQLWGNPLYRWDVMAKNGYAWWVKRMRMALKLYDIVRIDHFRGFQAFWSIPGGDTTAVNGTWEPGPDKGLFTALQKELGDLPVIAEDLGLITPPVEKLRDRFKLPGMKVLQFAFSGPTSEYLPHNFTNPNCVVYTGTHDNNTNRGWWDTLSRKEKQFARGYLPGKGRDISWDLMRLALSSVAKYAVLPLQDVLELSGEARMNTPGVGEGNWAWRYTANALTPAMAERLRDLTFHYGRAPVEVTPPVTAPARAGATAAKARADEVTDVAAPKGRARAHKAVAAQTAPKTAVALEKPVEPTKPKARTRAKTG